MRFQILPSTFSTYVMWDQITDLVCYLAFIYRPFHLPFPPHSIHLLLTRLLTRSCTHSNRTLSLLRNSYCSSYNYLYF